MSLAQDIERDLIGIERELAVEYDADGVARLQHFIWRRARVPCAPGAQSRGSEPVSGGFLVEYAQILIVRLSHFLTVDTTLITVDSELFTADSDLPRPVAGLTLKFPAAADPADVESGREYKIARTRVLPTRTHVELYLVDVNL